MSDKESVLLKTLQSSEDVQVRVEALRSLGSLATEIGEDRTTDVLLPQLKGLLEDDEEVLLVLVEELGTLVNFLSEAKLESFLFLLSGLCKVEEEGVRRKATDNLLALSNRLSTDSFSATYINLVISLGQTPWFTSKMAAAALLPSAFQRAGDDKKQTLIQLFLTLCKDRTPMARRAAATNMKYFVPHLSFESIMNEFVDCFQVFAKDEQDSVRFLCIEVGASLARAFKTANKPELTNTIIKPVVLACAEDRAWRVRFMVASGFVTLASEIEKDLVKELVHVFIKLLRDSEPEVRTAAAGKVSGVAKLLSLEDSVTHLLPCISALVKDSNQAVRAALAQDVMVLAPSFGKEGTNQHLLSIFLQLLKDDVPEVRLNVISKLDQVTPYVGLDQLSEHLIPAIVQLGEDKSWRVRLSVIGDIPPLAQQLSLDFFISSLGELCFSWLGDTVYAIRQAAISMLRKLTNFFGEPFSKVVVPRIAKLTANTNYLHRMTILFYAETCGPLMTQTFLRDNIFPLLFKMCADPVANMRMASARAMDVLLETADPQSKTELQPYIMKLLEDKDPDVHEASVGAQKKL